MAEKNFFPDPPGAESPRQKGCPAGAGGQKARVLVIILLGRGESLSAEPLERMASTLSRDGRAEPGVLVIAGSLSDGSPPDAGTPAMTRVGCPVTVIRNPKSLGPGWDLKLGFRYALNNGYDAVVTPGSVARCAPEDLPGLVAPLLGGRADAVFGSRALCAPGKHPATGGPSLTEGAVNAILVLSQKAVLGSAVSDPCCACAAYRVNALSSLPFEHNSDGPDFAVDLLVQLLDTGKRVAEAPAATGGFGAGPGFALRAVGSMLLSKIMRFGIYYHPKFDYEPGSNYRYKEKFGYPSSHQFAVDRVKEGWTVLDIGCGPGFMASRLAEKKARTISLDLVIRPETKSASWKCVEADADRYDFDEDLGKVDCILLLDIIEHMKSPERLFSLLRERFSVGAPLVVVTTGNIAFLPLRLSLLFAGFHYGRRGILDMDHTRLFTFASLKRTLRLAGYEILEERGLPAPFPLALGEGWAARLLLRLNCALISLWRGAFSFQAAVTARPLPTLQSLLDDALKADAEKRKNAV